MAKNKSKKEPVEVPSGKQVVTIPDEAIYYIVSNFLQEKTKVSGLSVLVGVPADTVEQVLRLFVEWSARMGYVRDGVLTVGKK